MVTAVVDMIELKAENTAFKQIPPADGGIEGTLLTYSFAAFLNTVKVGEVTRHCTVVSSSTAHCMNCLTLGGRGDIVFGGAESVSIERDVILPRPWEIVVLGGTGDFDGVNGMVHMGPLPGTDQPQQGLQVELVFHLLWP